MTTTTVIDLQTPIEELEITVRLFNTLKREGIHTVGDAIKFSEAELIEIPGVGTSAVNDIRDKLEEAGLAFKAGPSVPRARTKSQSEAKTHENKMRRFAKLQGLYLVKSPRRDPRARGYGRYVLVPDDRSSVKEPIDQEVLDDAHLKLDRGDGLTLSQIEQELGYGSEEVK